MRKLVLGAIVGLLLCSTSAFAEGVEQRVKDLEKVVAEQQRTISDLTQRLDIKEELGSSWSSGEKEKTSWFDNLKFSGDLRYRHEYIDDDRKDRDRHRNRIRARLNLKAKVNDDVDVGFQLSTGGSATSGNATLTSLWAPKGFYLTKAYFDWHPGAVEGLHVIGGKMGIPFFRPQKSEVIWDGDLCPEGMLVKFSGDVSEDFELSAQVFGFWNVERSSDEDSGLFGGQVSGKFGFDAMDGSAYFFGGLGCFRYIHPTDNGGGLIDTDEIDYHLYNAFLEFGAKIQEIPFSVYVDYVTNTAVDNDDADDETTGWGIGLKVGKAKKPGQWEAKYIYKHVEKFAVFAGFADSDFGGGKANAEGHEVAAKVALMKNWTLGGTLFINTTGIADGDEEEDYMAFQIDLVFKFK